MQTIKVPLKEAQKVKKILIEKKILDRLHKPKKEGGSLFFPIVSLKPIKKLFKDYVFEEKKLEKIQKKDYKSLLPKKIELPSSYDIVGNIIIIEITKKIEPYEKEIANALLKTHKNVKTILKKAGQHSGEFRTQNLLHLAGENTKETVYKENGVRLLLDVEKVYFSSRLSTERKRIYKKIKNNENILVMFAGCGPYPLTISKNTDAKHIIGIEKNPIGEKYFKKNIKLNKIKNIESILGDVIEEVPKIKQKFDRIIMPLPKDAAEFLYLAFHVSKKGTIIHLYGFEHETEFDNALKKIDVICKQNNINYKIHELVKCGQYSPGKYRICIDFEVL